MGRFSRTERSNRVPHSPDVLLAKPHHMILLLIATLYVSTNTAWAESDVQLQVTPTVPQLVASETRNEPSDSDNKFQRRALQVDVENDGSDKVSSRSDGLDEDIDLSGDEPKYITKEPRQQFKIHLGPTKSHKRSFKSMVAKRQQDGIGSTALTESKAPTNATGGTRVRAKSGKQMLSSETLKKLLLNQSMLSKNPNLFYSNANALNSTSTGQPGKAGSNFKFVFIQRATAAPSKTATTLKNDSPPTSQAAHQSLAASVSKQLASSLLYSAANLVGNLTAAPSISALSNAASTKTSTSSTGELDANIATSGPSDTGSNDIRRMQTPLVGVKSSQHTSGRKQKPLRRPSKVYNLPVKFVANGQPNGVVFSAIKQHFAAIRKMQSAATTAAATGNSNRKITTFVGSKDRRKQQQNQSDRKKWKGGNSRLIYLPLKYLSNAKPERLVSPKAAHKSSETTVN